ncbi:MAG: cysteine hydrolase [Alphaproteobacteria bacterium]|nr:cysteine hydrolase [Alphaproteobacteria bacterium]
MNDTLPFGPIEGPVLHAAIDMQVMFDHGTEWASPAVRQALPGAMALTQARPRQTVLTRFLPPHRPDAAPGRWRFYYERWRDICLDKMDPSLAAVVTPLAAVGCPILDKAGHSAFDAPSFRRRVEGIETLILSGVETDVCVLATALDAVDAGLRVIVAADAVASASEAGHRATLDAVLSRFDRQVEIATVAAILDGWFAQS